MSHLLLLKYILLSACNRKFTLTGFAASIKYMVFYFMPELQHHDTLGALSAPNTASNKSCATGVMPILALFVSY